MKAILGIQRTVTLYGQLLDDLRMEDWGRLFTDDAVWAMPSFTFTAATKSSVASARWSRTRRVLPSTSPSPP